MRLTLKLRPTGLLSGLRGPVEQHIDIVDYPGEWLLDLGLMDKSYEEWSTDVFHRMANRSFGANYVNALTDLDPSDPFHRLFGKCRCGRVFRFITWSFLIAG